jgi:Flp pilus assembly protein protease CpaA
MILIEQILAFFWILGLVIASYNDVKYRRVPNKVNFGYLWLGLAYQLILSGLPGLWFALQGVLCAFAILLIPFALYIYRGGDVKLCMAAATWVGAEAITYSIVYAVILGGVWGLVKLLLMPKVQRSKHIQNLNLTLYTRQLPKIDHSQSAHVQYIPMALVFSVTIIYVDYQNILLIFFKSI